jgi:hypothetical protein
VRDFVPARGPDTRSILEILLALPVAEKAKRLNVAGAEAVESTTALRFAGALADSKNW